MSIKVDYAMIDENNDLNLCNGEKYSHIVATFFIFFFCWRLTSSRHFNKLQIATLIWVLDYKSYYKWKSFILNATLSSPPLWNYMSYMCAVHHTCFISILHVICLISMFISYNVATGYSFYTIVYLSHIFTVLLKIMMTHRL